MPFAGEHAARVRNPSAFQTNSFRRKNIARGVDIILARLKGESSLTAQSYRFDSKTFTAAEAKAWLKEHDVEYTSFEPATDKEQKPPVEPEGPVEQKKDLHGGQIVYMVPMEATSFADVDEYLQSVEASERVKELTRMFQTLSENIMLNQDVADKSAALRSLVDEFDAKVGAAISKEQSVVGLLKQAGRKVLGLGSKMEKTEPKPPGLMIWKEGETYRWLAVYSNKYRDQDNPPEILSAAAHKNFIARVDAGELPYPVLQHYHVKGTDWGVSDWLAFDEATGFTLASGTVDAGHEKEAEAIMAFQQPLGVSHGLEVGARNVRDPSIIEEYITEEISDLPLKAAANQLTGFHILDKGATDMSIPDAKKDHLRKVGISDEKIAKLEGDLESKAQVARAAGLDFKQAKTEEPAPAPTPEPTPTEDEPVAAYATREEVATAIAEAVSPILQGMQTLTVAMEKMATSDEERIAAKAADTPAMSIGALVTKQLSAIGRDETRLSVDDMKLAKSKPKETEARESKTGIPFIDSILAEKA